jgi:hypothetical protein
LSINRLNYNTNLPSQVYEENLINNFTKILPNRYKLDNSLDFSFFLKIPNILSVLSAENDSKQYSNSFKFILNTKHKKKSLQNLDFTMNNLFTVDPTNSFSNSLYNTENTLKFKDYKSPNAQFLGSERTSRLVNNVNSNSFK